MTVALIILAVLPFVVVVLAACRAAGQADETIYRESRRRDLWAEFGDFRWPPR